MNWVVVVSTTITVTTVQQLQLPATTTRNDNDNHSNNNHNYNENNYTKTTTAITTRIITAIMIKDITTLGLQEGKHNCGNQYYLHLSCHCIDGFSPQLGGVTIYESTIGTWYVICVEN